MGDKMDSNENSYVLSLDIGTTNIRAYIYDKDANVIGQSQDQVTKNKLFIKLLELIPSNFFRK